MSENPDYVTYRPRWQCPGYLVHVMRYVPADDSYEVKETIGPLMSEGAAESAAKMKAASLRVEFRR